MTEFPPALNVPEYPFVHLGGEVKFLKLLKNTTRCPQPGLQPGSFDPKLSALTMRPPRLHKAR